MGSRRSPGLDSSRGRVAPGGLAVVLITVTLLGGVGQVAGGVIDLQQSPPGDGVTVDPGAVAGSQPANDRFEPNDDRDRATALGANATVEDLRIVDGESDYFALNLSRGESITATALFDDTQGDLDVALLGPDGTFVDSSNSVTDDETVSGVAGQNGTYYVRVYGFSGASAPYSLEVDVTDTGTADWSAGNTTNLEPNEHFASAARITAGRYTGLEIDSIEDHDYYAVDLDAGQSLTTHIEFSDALGDLDVTVFGPDEERLEGSYSVTDDERVEITAVESGTHYIEVYGYSGATAPYTLEVIVDGRGPDDVDDNDEDTDDERPDEPGEREDDPPFSAGEDLRSIDIGATAAGEIDDSDPESDENRGHYEPVTFNGSAGELLTISMSSVQGDTYLILRGPGGEVIERNDDGGGGLDSEIRGVELPEDGEYTIVATSYSSFDTFEYTLSVSRGFGGGARPITMDLTTNAPTVTAGNSVTVSFNLTNTAAETAPFVVETGLDTLPAGWRITSHSDDGATWRGIDAAWVVPAVRPNSSVTPSVTVDVPANATTREFRAFGYAQRGQVSAPFTIEVEPTG